MFRIIISIALIFICFKNTFCQDIQLENFDTKESIKSWNVISDIQIKHTNKFIYNGKIYYKKSLDSFFVFSDTLGYQVTITRKFKMIPSRSITFHHSVFSEDSSNDYLDYGFIIFDKNGKKLYTYFYHSQHFIIPNLAISQAGIQLPDDNDTIWKKADSIEVVYSFKPHSWDSIRERVIVLDGITLLGKYASLKNYRTPKFEIYPNPANDILNFKFSSSSNPKNIYIYDYTGRMVLQSIAKDVLILDKLKPGFYFVTIQFENGSATKKIEIL